MQNLKFAFRQLWKNPGFTTVAVLTLALGIGANTAIFAVLDPLLLRKLPIRKPDELVWVASAGSLGRLGPGSSEIQSYYTYRDAARVFTGVLAYTPLARYEIALNSEAHLANGEYVSRNFFEMLGVRPFAGTFFTTVGGGDAENGVVLSFDYWRRAFAFDRGIVGRSFPLEGRSYTVIGVAPPGFFGVEVGKSCDFYRSLGDLPSDADRAGAHWVTILARLKQGISMAGAQAGLVPLFGQVARDSTLPEIEKEQWLARPSLIPAGHGLSELREQYSRPAIILIVVVAFVLFIACANVANLLLSKGIGRRREFAIRLALGGGRWRLTRQLLTESALLVTLGGAAALLIGVWGANLLAALLSTESLPIALSVGLGARVLFFTAAIMGLTIALCGVAPALSASRAELADSLKAQAQAFSGTSSQSRLGGLLVAGQVAVAVTLLAGAALLARSLSNLETFDAGFNRNAVLMVSINDVATGRPPEERRVVYDELLDRAKTIPGVRSACYAFFTPMSGRELGVNIEVEGYVPAPAETANERFVGVSPGYFATMGIPLLAGRDFTTQDVQSPFRTAIINQTMAHRFFKDRSPIGKQLRMVEGRRPPIEIIGVVADSKYNSLREPSRSYFYVPRLGGTLVVRTDQAPMGLAAPLRDLIRGVDSAATVTGIRTLREQVDESLHEDRLIAVLCGTFSLLALALTSVGIYGALSSNVVRRTGELAIRVALGARPVSVFRLVVRQGTSWTLLGLFLGVIGALALGAILKAQLFGVSAFDPINYIGVALVLLLVSFLACWLPARRAAKVDPMEALRCE